MPRPGIAAGERAQAPGGTAAAPTPFDLPRFPLPRNVARLDWRISEALGSASICVWLNFFKSTCLNTFCVHSFTDKTSGP